MTRRGKLILIAPFAIVGMALFIFLGGWIVMSLWNYLLPGLFGWRIITFWQALAMLVLCRILFGGISGRGWHGRRRWKGERWGHMSDEEREKFREAVRAKWGFGPHASEGREA
jgi:MFS family permease